MKSENGALSLTMLKSIANYNLTVSNFMRLGKRMAISTAAVSIEKMAP